MTYRIKHFGILLEPLGTGMGASGRAPSPVRDES